MLKCINKALNFNYAIYWNVNKHKNAGFFFKLIELITCALQLNDV